MSIAIQPRRNEPDEDATQAAAIVNSNKNQQWYQKLCRGGEQPVYLEEQKVYPSPQRVQLQLHFQREYQQRQELQKNCRQDWWQRKSGSVAPSPSPVHFRTPSPAPGHKYYSNGPLFYQESPHHQPSPNVMPRGRTPQPPTNSYYQPSAAGVQARSENRRRTECELVDSEREKMIKTAQVIKLDAEKRIRQAKRELAASSSDQENIQRLLIQLLKEQDLAQKLKLSNQTPPTPNPISHLSADLQYKLATLLQAYQPTPPQQLSTNQRKWQEQIATYKDMLQEYRHGNFFQSHQKAKRLLQLLLQKDPNAHLHLPPQFYTSHPQQQTMYQQPPNQVGNSNMQPYFRTPFPQPAVRSRRDPRLNRSSQQLQTQVHDITPRLNQSSCQYSEQDITPEIIYPADVSARPGTVRRNSTPRKQTDEQVTHGENVSTVVEGAKKHSEQHVKFAENLEIEKDYQKPVETSRGANVTKAHAPVAAVEHDCDNQAGSRAPLQDWEQLQQRSRRHRRGRGVRRSSQESEGSDQKKPVDGKGGKTSPVLSNAKGQKHSPVNQKPHGDIPRRNADAMAEGEGRKSFPEDEVQHKDIVSQSESKTETQLEPADYSDKKDHPDDTVTNEISETKTLNENQSGLSHDAQFRIGDLGSGKAKTQDERSAPTENQKRCDRFSAEMPAQTDAQEIANKSKKDNENLMDNENKQINKSDKTAKQQQNTSLLNRSVSADLEDSSLDEKRYADKDKTAKSSSLSPNNTQPVSEGIQKSKSSRVNYQRQYSEPHQSRSKQQPSTQSQLHAPLRGQTPQQRHAPTSARDQQSQRTSRSHPSPRTARHLPQGSQQSLGNTIQTQNGHAPSQTSQKLPEAQLSQTETYKETAENVSKSESPKTDKAEGTKSPGNSAPKQVGRRSPGNTYVVRNSGQRFAKPPTGAQKDRQGSTVMAQGRGASRSKNSSPKSNASKSPPEPASKAQVSPPSAKPRRRRYRRKPWEKDDMDMTRSSSAPHSQYRGQERPRDQTQQPGWVSSSPRQWTGPRYDWEPQPRRRPYQWDDSKAAPARKWRAVGQQGGTLPTKINANAEQMNGFGHKAEKSKVSPELKSTSTKGQSTTLGDLQDTSEDLNKCNGGAHQESFAEDGAQAEPEQTASTSRLKFEDDGEHENINGTRSSQDLTSKLYQTGEKDEADAITGPKLSEQGKGNEDNAEKTVNTGNTDDDSCEKTQNVNTVEEREVEKYRNDSEDLKIQNGSKVEEQNHQIQQASQKSASNASDTGFQAAKVSPETQTDAAFGSETGTDPTTRKEETAAGETDELQRESDKTRQKPESLLEHVLAVLGKKGHHEAEEQDSEDGASLLLESQETESDDTCQTRDSVECIAGLTSVVPNSLGGEVSQGQALLNGAQNMTRTVSDDGIMVDRPPSRACEVAPDTTDRQDTRTENSPPASSAKIISLEEMEDWQSLGDLDQSGRKSDVCKSQSHEHLVSPVMNDQRQEETTEKELAESAAQQASTPNQFGITLEETSQENEIGVESSCQAEHSERTDEKDHHEVARKTLGVSPGDNTSRSVPVEEIICRDISKKLQIPCVISEHVSETSTTTHLPGLEGKDGDDLETSERAQHEPGENREELPAASCSATFGTNLRPNAPDGSLCLKATENCFQSINTDITKDKPDLRTPNRNTTCPSDVDSEKVAPIPSLSSLAQTVAVKFSVMGSPSTGPSWTESTTPGDTTDKNKTARCTPLAELAKDRSDAHDTEVASSTSSGESTGECHAVQNPGVRVLLQSTLTDRVKSVNSGKKKTVSFADFLDSPSWDKGADADEGYTASRKAAQYGNAKMKSPPAEVRVFSWDTDSNETVSVQTTARNCSACGHRRTADSPGNCNIATGEVLLDKLTAFGYL